MNTCPKAAVAVSMLVPSRIHAKYQLRQNAESPCNPQLCRVFNPKITHSIPRRPFRKGGDGLAALVQEMLEEDPFSGTIFIFRAKRAQSPTFRIPFSFCDDCLSLAPVVRADVAGIAVSPR